MRQLRKKGNLLTKYRICVDIVVPLLDLLPVSPPCQVMSLGFVKESLDAVVDGVVASIQAAHENMRPGKLFLNSGLLADANINRSPTAYMRNPKEERER